MQDLNQVSNDTDHCSHLSIDSHSAAALQFIRAESLPTGGEIALKTLVERTEEWISEGKASTPSFLHSKVVQSLGWDLILKYLIGLNLELLLSTVKNLDSFVATNKGSVPVLANEILKLRKLQELLKIANFRTERKH